jgi:hypothetical protein
MLKTTYDIECLEECTPVQGNALASGDVAEDKAAEDAILERLERNDIWAWCTVRVVARVEGLEIVGDTYLGCCSYADEADFKTGGYYEQMCAEAREDLREKCSAQMEDTHKMEAILNKLED